MYRAEIHDTIEDVQLLEKLDLELDITERAYRSEHELEGELRVFTEPTSRVVRDREAPPRTLVSPLRQLIFDTDGQSLGGLGTRGFVGLARDVPLSVDEEAYKEDHHVDPVDVAGVPENGAVEFDLDWDRGEAERMLSEGETRVHSESYDVEGLPGDRLPVIVRADLHRDATVLAEKFEDSTERHAGGGVQSFEGQAALALRIEYRDTAESSRQLKLDRLDLELSHTFPQIWFQPEESATYDPEAMQVEWSNRRVSPGEAEEFAVFGPLSELLDIEAVTASFRAQLPGESLTGLRIAGVFDESGEAFLSSDADDVDHLVRVTCSAEIDPSALRGEVQEVTNATIRLTMTPKQLYQRLRKVCNANGIHIRDSDNVGKGEPVPGRDGVFEVTEGNTDDDEEGVGDAGWLKVSKEYGDRGVVYADMTVTGEFTAMSQEQEVSAFDETEDRIVRADQGGLDTRGEAKLDIKTRSSSSELNSELISTFEMELEGGAG